MLSASIPAPASATGDTPEAAPIERSDSIAGTVARLPTEVRGTMVVRADDVTRTLASAWSTAVSSSTSSVVRARVPDRATRTVTVVLVPGAMVAERGSASTRVPRLVDPDNPTVDGTLPRLRTRKRAS